MDTILSTQLVVGKRFRVTEKAHCFRGTVAAQLPDNVEKGTMLVYVGLAENSHYRFHLEGNENDIIDLRPWSVDNRLEEA